MLTAKDFRNVASTDIVAGRTRAGSIVAAGYNCLAPQPDRASCHRAYALEFAGGMGRLTFWRAVKTDWSASIRRTD